MATSQSDTRQRNGWLQFALAAAVSLYLYLNLFALPNTPYLLVGDQLFFWSDAMRMLQGEQVYRDFFQFTAPGIDFYFLGLFRLFGVHIWVTDLALILLGVALCWVFFSLAAEVLEFRWAVLATAFYLVFLYGRVLDATHHWFSMLAIACAIRVLMPERTLVRVAIAGAFLGVASFFTQTSGVAGLLGLCAALAFEHRLRQRSWRSIVELQSVLLLSFLLTWGAESAYYLAHVGWKQLWYLWVTYAANNVAYTQHFLAPGTLVAEVHKSVTNALQRFFVLGLVLCIYPWTVWRCLRRRVPSELPDAMQLLLLSLPGFVLLVEVLIKPNWNRIYMAALPGVILLMWWLSRAGRWRRCLTLLLWAVTLCSGLSQTVSTHRHATVAMLLPAGRAIPVDARYDPEFAWLSKNTRPGDLFLQAAWLNTYLPLELRSPVYVDGLWPTAKTPAAYVALATRQVEEKQVKYVLWSPHMIGPVDLGAGRHDSLSPFREYLLQHYRRVQVFPSQDEIWQRQSPGAN